MSTLPLAPEEYLSLLEGLTSRFQHTLRTAELDSPVVSCGDWRLRDLGAHLGDIHRWAARIVITGERPEQAFASDPGPGVADWYADSAAELIEAFRGADPAAPCWHFGGGGKDKAFWFRRQVQETAMHLFDASLAAGAPVRFAPVVAADGVDEVLTVLLPKVQRWHAAPPLPKPLLVRTVDTGHAWLVRPADGDGPPLASTVADGENAETSVEAYAEDLLLFMWKRRPAGESGLKTTGEPAVSMDFLGAGLTP
ncbi:MAG: hypothetical protein JWQ81_1945 [Amycolatopsis sp.]|jgi:uncharacterized protein (TIGR03083 family)|uniref:maleylpyruvate isomerase family mycothiol-dependent enzyme n=1 Tax=Amycolatopsis sp. TaxID=37632 RepID=UPI002613FC2F|nr:maleylpyruvate isomerase family mycothiol-dependent enzyme [Amycolatopsis sp.]MCU1681206.1 hypothetical protein [Amycolatopsis sp.]